jgi:hypothetical protein
VLVGPSIGLVAAGVAFVALWEFLQFPYHHHRQFMTTTITMLQQSLWVYAGKGL